LDPAQLERLFEAFYTTKPGGLGMGLSICRSIIEAHDGRLWAEANEPKGAVFQFILPQEDTEAGTCRVSCLLHCRPPLRASSTAGPRRFVPNNEIEAYSRTGGGTSEIGLDGHAFVPVGNSPVGDRGPDELMRRRGDVGRQTGVRAQASISTQPGIILLQGTGIWVGADPVDS
jgi:hypothetical protein